MKTFALVSALALAGGLAVAAPAYAGYYDTMGYYHPTASDYSYRGSGSLSQIEIRAEVRDQGYTDIRDLRHVPFTDRWVATAYEPDGDLVRITIDGDDGRVIDVDNI